MARSPRGHCITCDKYTTLMYVDQCRTCFEFEESIGKGDDGSSPPVGGYISLAEAERIVFDMMTPPDQAGGDVRPARSVKWHHHNQKM